MTYRLDANRRPRRGLYCQVRGCFEYASMTRLVAQPKERPDDGHHELTVGYCPAHYGQAQAFARRRHPG